MGQVLPLNKGSQYDACSPLFQMYNIRCSIYSERRMEAYYTYAIASGTLDEISK